MTFWCCCTQREDDELHHHGLRQSSRVAEVDVLDARLHLEARGGEPELQLPVLAGPTRRRREAHQSRRLLSARSVQSRKAFAIPKSFIALSSLQRLFHQHVSFL